MKKIKELLRSRRGIAIELAIGIMIVSVAISTILLSTAVIQIERKNDDLNKFKEFVTIEQLKAEYSDIELLFEAYKTNGQKEKYDFQTILDENGEETGRLKVIYKAENVEIANITVDNDNNIIDIEWITN